MVIPGWQSYIIGDLLEFKNGLNKGKEFFGTGTPIINYVDVYSNTGLYSKDIKGSVTLSAAEIKRYDAKKGDVFFTRTSETPAEVGLSCVLLENVCNCVFSGFVLRGRPITDKLDSSYSKYCFRMPEIRASIISECTYTTRALTNGRQLSKIAILLPPVPEQQAIAIALSDVDELIDSLESLIEKKKAIKKGAMQELLIKNTKNWTLHFLGDICDIENGTVITENKIKNGSVPVIAGGKQPAYYHNEANRKANTITISASGANAGFVSFYEEPIYASDCSTISASKTYDVKFIYYSLLLMQSNIISMQTGGAQPHVRPIDLKKLNIYLPPLLKDQHRIAEILSDMDTEIEALTQKLEKSRQIKQGMMQELLTGRIRLLETATQKQKKAKVKKVPKAEAKQQGHNEHFHEAVILSTVVSLFASEQFPLGRFRRQKFAYLLHRYEQESTQGFLKKAAGPYNPTIRYKDEKIALKAGYVTDLGKSKFVQGEKSSEAVSYFVQWYGEDAIEWIKQFQYRKNDDLEVLTTVAEAIVDLKKSNLAITVESVKQVIRENPEWRPKLDKDCFSDFKIQSAIKESQKLFG